MNNTIKETIETEARRTALRYDPSYSRYSAGKQVGHIRGFIEGAKYVLDHLSHIPWDEALNTLAEYASESGKEARP